MGSTVDARVNLERKRALLYHKAEYHDDARNAWEDALTIASSNENREDIVAEILAEMESYGY